MQDATNRWDFLTGLELVCRVKLSARDREFFGHVQEAWTQMVRSVVKAFRGGVSAWAMLSWERTLGRKLREMGRLFVEHVVNRIEPEDERELPQHERQVLDGLKERHGVCWSVQTLRKVVAAVDELSTPQRQEAQVERLLGWLRVAEKSSGRHTPVLSVGRDGILLPIRARDKYQEGSTATVAVYDRHQKRLGTIDLGQMPESGQAALSQALTRLLTDVLTRWDGLTPKLNDVTDGGHHPTEYFETVLSLMPDPRRPGKTLPWEWIVDDDHACQDITLLAEALFGSGRAAFAWAKKQRQVLKTKEGGVFRVLHSAGALRTTRGLVGSAEDYFRGDRYLRDRAVKMNYAAAFRRGLPIGSGVTEAGCKTLFTQRFKQPGMKWTVTGGQPILNLRTISLSRVWSAVRDRAWQSYEIPQPLTHTAKPKIKSQKPRKLAV